MGCSFYFHSRSLHNLICFVWPLAMSALEAIRWRQGPPAVLQLLDQRLLPLQTVYIDIQGPESAWHAIKVCRVAATLMLITCVPCVHLKEQASAAADTCMTSELCAGYGNTRSARHRDCGSAGSGC